MPKVNITKAKKKKPEYDNIFKTKLNFNCKLVINIILISILLIGSIFIFAIASTIKYENRELIISYEEKSDVSYVVNLKNNSFYSTKTLGMNQLYPAGVIDNIKVKYKYDFKTSEKGNYKYRYFATATIVANDKNMNIGENNLLLSRSYQLENQITGEQSLNDRYELDKEYVINYDTYNNFVNRYKNSYGLTIDAHIRVSMYVEIIDSFKDKVINRAKTMDVNIPLASNPIKIDINKPEDISEALYDESNDVTISGFFIVFALIMFISGIMLLIQEIIKVINSQNEQSRFINKLNKIISTNSDVIVKTNNKINLKNHNIIDVETIDELLDVQNELRIPIVYFETNTNKEGFFVIIDGKQVWRYIFKLEKEKK